MEIGLLNEDKNIMQEIFQEYERIYHNILKKIYPAKNSTGFPERNLSVNFSKAYEKIASKKGQDSVSWFEFQFGKNNRKHVDLIILNESTKELFIVESKRFNNPENKTKEVGKDIQRIYELIEELKTDNSRINIKRIKHIYGIILADVWIENDKKIEIFKSFNDSTFIKERKKELEVTDTLNEKYYIQEIKGISEPLEKYKLISFVWEI